MDVQYRWRPGTLKSSTGLAMEREPLAKSIPDLKIARLHAVAPLAVAKLSLERNTPVGQGIKAHRDAPNRILGLEQQPAIPVPGKRQCSNSGKRNGADHAAPAHHF